MDLCILIHSNDKLGKGIWYITQILQITNADTENQNLLKDHLAYEK